MLDVPNHLLVLRKHGSGFQENLLLDLPGAEV